MKKNLSEIKLISEENQANLKQLSFFKKITITLVNLLIYGLASLTPLLVWIFTANTWFLFLFFIPLLVWISDNLYFVNKHKFFAHIILKINIMFINNDKDSQKYVNLIKKWVWLNMLFAFITLGIFSLVTFWINMISENSFLERKCHYILVN